MVHWGRCLAGWGSSELLSLPQIPHSGRLKESSLKESLAVSFTLNIKEVKVRPLLAEVPGTALLVWWGVLGLGPLSPHPSSGTPGSG